MTQIKICGIKRLEDVDFANEFMPDYIGFVFAKSKRQVDCKTAKKLISKLNKNIKRVGVFENQEIEEVKNIINSLKIDILQFHGDESQEFLENFKGYVIWKAFGIETYEDLKQINDFNIDGILLDNKTSGSGKNFDWKLIKDLNFKAPIILAGGLSPDNVCKAISIVNPQVVDVSSGVETEGVKDYLKINQFISKVREIK